MSRNLLHKSKLEAFKAWLDKQGIQHRPTEAAYQVLQIRLMSRKGETTGWTSIYERLNSTEHYTNDVRLESMIYAFIRDSRKEKETS